MPLAMFALDAIAVGLTGGSLADLTGGSSGGLSVLAKNAAKARAMSRFDEV